MVEGTGHFRVLSHSKSDQKPRLRKQKKQEVEVEKIVKLTCFADYDIFKDDPKNSINRFTVCKSDAPVWLAEDGFIIQGHRRLTNSWRGCLLSLFYWHNETGNVYTHLLGFLACFPVLYLLFFEWMIKVPTTTALDYVAQFAFIFGLMCCLGFSTLFHLCCCHSRSVSLLCNRADYVGIVCLQIGSFIPMFYYGFFCDVFYQQLYLIATIILGSITVIFVN